MSWRPRTWFLLSLMFFIAAGWFWRLGNERTARNASPATNAPVKASPTNTLAALLSLQPAPAAKTASLPPVALAQKTFPYRLSNTTKPLKDLMRDDHAILLRNALIDTAEPAALKIPEPLRAKGEPGGYLVQPAGELDDAFRERLRAAGATIISYVPNNAYLVRVSDAGAQQLKALPQTQVLPWEPYFKLDPRLLAAVLDEKPMPANGRLNVLLYPGERDAMLQELQVMGAAVLGEDRAPFGPILVVQTARENLATVAQSSRVQGIEPRLDRAPANDLSRARLGVAADTVTSEQYLGLAGSNVLVAVSDTGIDVKHPDLSGRVTVDAPGTDVDLNGHGTHVAGIIASSGEHSAGVKAVGSETNASFRGKAPAAKIFAMPIDLITGPVQSDAYLQETAARTNAFISNNSWIYPGAADYTYASASYDAAVRDALPEVTGSQPLLFVFAAGNEGFGDFEGQG
ncbi:MAG TPA: S8 family serine peptidase, partial [Candidatus Eisenbacteria bacterium]|nr:S8 family serine peptidase [Candidatus Eisenbacteria bacterium]